MASPGPISRALAAALKDAKIPDRDAAAVALIRRYAYLLDEARGTEGESRVFSELGPKLLAALTSVGLTLAGRGAQAQGGDPGVGVAARLDEFTARRAGKHPA